MKVFGIGIAVVSWLLALYIGLWCMFIQPIIGCAHAFDTGTLTGIMVAVCVLKCVLASAVGTAIAWVGTMLGGVVTALAD